MEHSDTLVFSGILVAYRPRPVLAAVVNEEHLEVGEGLGEDAVYATRQVLLHVVDGDYNAYLGIIVHCNQYFALLMGGFVI